MEKQLSALDKEMSTLNKIGKVLGDVRPGDVIIAATLSPEARQVYSYLLSGLEQGNKEVQKSARAAALVAARMTDRLVSFHREAGEAGYTAMDALPELLTNAGQETQEKEAAQRFAQAVESQKEAVRRQYEGTDMWMKAPNGQPTNLTEDQWLAVRTPEFKAWFGDWEAEYRKQENIERGTRAVDEVLRTRQDVPKAMFRSETGGIDFVYGKEGAPSKKYAGGYGIAHILAKHGQAAVDMIPTVIAKGKATQKHNDRIRFNYAGYTAVVRLDFDGNQKTWLVTNFEKYANKKDSLTAEVFARSADDPDGAHSTVGGNLSLGFTIPQGGANSQAVSKVVDENGEPLVVYHGSDAQFDVFDKTKGRANMDIQGMFFSPWKIDAQGYGGHVRAFFLNIKNPANEGQGYKALNRYVGQNYAGIKAREDLASHGYDGVNNGDEEFIAFEPTQIKSVDNNGNFSADDPNIYHQVNGGSKNSFAARQEKGGDRENRDNEISQEVFQTYLNDGIMRSVEKTVAAEIGQYTNLDAMADPVAKDKARDELPYIHKMLADFNLTVVQKNKKYKDRLAAKIEYARRCFDNDERIQSRIVRQMDGNEGQGDVYSTGREVVPGRNDTSGVGEASRRSARRVSNQVSGEKRGAREHFEKLYNEMAKKHSENQGAFSHGLRLEQSAWHGSPHIFDYFDLGAIGTGEGAQVHGWGLYFAKDQEIAGEYKLRLGGDGDGIRFLGDRYIKTNEGWCMEDIINDTSAFVDYDDPLATVLDAFDDYEDVDTAIQELHEELNAKYDEDDPEGEQLREAIRMLEEDGDTLERFDGGSLFEVEIPDDDVLLDEQKNFKEQPPKVKEGLWKLIDHLTIEQLENWDDVRRLGKAKVIAKIKQSLSQTDGGHIYGTLIDLVEGDKEASLLLNRYGIQGITYDGQQDGRCFVIFDDQAISIIERYNQAIKQEVKGDYNQAEAIIRLFEGADTWQVQFMMKAALLLTSSATCNRQEMLRSAVV